MARKTRKKPVETYALYIFEITDWEPAYHLSVNASRFDDGAFSEINHLQVSSVCRYPKKLVGRSACFDLYGTRGFLEPYEWQRDRSWRPASIAHLDMPPSGGRCYVPMPNESIGVVMTALAHDRFRYVSLHGKPLLRGKAACWSIGFSRDEDLGEGAP